MRKNTDIVVVRQHYPSKSKPNSSYWVHEQVRDITEKGLNFSIISPQPIKGIFCINSCLPTVDEFNGFQVLRPLHIHLPNFKFYKVTNWSLQRSIIQSLKKVDFKLIHAHFGNDGVASIGLQRKYKKPLITSFYGFDLSDKLDVLLPYYKHLASQGDLFLALSKDMKSDLIKAGFPEEKILIHHLGVNLQELLNYKKKRNNNKIIFSIVARFIERKGISDSLKAFYTISNKYSNVQLRLIGDGPERNNIISLINELNLSNKVIIINNYKEKSPRKTVLQEIVDSDVFMLNSYITERNSKEGTPIVLMEAQAMGVPCIATNHAGIPEIVVDGSSGIIVKERKVSQIVAAMEKLIIEEETRKNFGEFGKKFIKSHFNNEIQHQKLFEIYKRILRKDKQ